MGLIEIFADRASEVGAVVHQGDAALSLLHGLTASYPNLRVSEAASRMTGLEPTSWADSVGELVESDELSPLVGVVGAAAGIAETGSALFIHDDINEVWLTGVSDRLVVTLKEESVVESLSEVAPMLSGLSSSWRIWTLLTGPSRTADIERILTIGVHGYIDMDLVLL